MHPTEDLITDLLMALAASIDPDNMYYHQDMKEPDRLNVIEATVDKIMGQMAHG
jgi:hypothetical protein